MAIPANLQKVFVEGVWRDPDDPDVDVFHWALTWHVDVDIMTGGVPDPAKLAVLGTERMNSLIGGGGLFTAFGEGSFCTRRGALNLLSDVGGVTVADVQLQANSPLPICSPATAIFVLGQTNILNHQTRKWMPCVRRDLLLDHVPKWSFSEEGGPLGFLDWCRLQLTDLNYVGIGVGTEVVWDASNEVMRPITQIKIQSWPRTIRARVLDAPAEWF